MVHASKRAFMVACSIALFFGLVAIAPFNTSRAVKAPEAPEPHVLQAVASPPTPSSAPTMLIAANSSLAVYPRLWKIGADIDLDLIDPGENTELLKQMSAAIRPEAPSPTPKPKPKSLYVPGDGPAMRGTLIMQTERLDVYVGKGSFTIEQVAALAPRLERLLMVNENGFWPTKLDHRVSIGFYSRASAPSRGTRGMAYTSENRIEVFFNSNEDPAKAATIAAHELAHHLQYQRYGKDVQQRADTILHEGQATWVSGIRWLSEYKAESWRRRAKQINETGVPLILVGAERYGADNAYELWASFVSYLVKFYGMESFDALYASSSGRAVGSANYEGVYGKSLQELADEWREYIQTIPPPTPEPSPTPELTPTP